MNTTGIQNYLSNVFRPIVVYDTAASNFTPKLEMSNIDTYSGNTVSVFTAGVGDANSNVYVGKEAGNLFTNLKACRYVSAFGYAAGSNISNDSNSVYLGYYAGSDNSNTSSIIAIGSEAGKIGTGVSNILIGTNTTSRFGSSNIVLGHGIDLSGVSNQIRIGLGTNTPIAANLSNGWLGFGGITSPYNINFSKIDVSGNTRIQGNLGLNIDPGTRTLDVNGNFRARDAALNILDFSNGLTRSSAGFASLQSNLSVPVGSTPIGSIRRGIIHVSAIDQASSANRAAYIYFAWTTSNVTPLMSNISGDTDINTSSTDIQISNTTSTKTYDYNITYFPLP
jgi:hypothetical protein